MARPRSELRTVSQYGWTLEVVAGPNYSDPVALYRDDGTGPVFRMGNPVRGLGRNYIVSLALPQKEGAPPEIRICFDQSLDGPMKINPDE